MGGVVVTRLKISALVVLAMTTTTVEATCLVKKLVQTGVYLDVAPHVNNNSAKLKFYPYLHFK